MQWSSLSKSKTKERKKENLLYFKLFNGIFMLFFEYIILILIRNIYLLYSSFFNNYYVWFRWDSPQINKRKIKYKNYLNKCIKWTKIFTPHKILTLFSFFSCLFVDITHHNLKTIFLFRPTKFEGTYVILFLSL